MTEGYIMSWITKFKSRKIIWKQDQII